MSKPRHLFLAAHPDDEVLGCAGTIAARAAAGHEVFIAILGGGVTSRADAPEEGVESALAALKAQSRGVAELLGATEHFMFDLPDNRVDTVPLLEVTQLIEGLVDELKPEVVYTQHGGDLNVDHQRIFQATLTATRPMSGSAVRQVLAYEVPSSTEWAFQRFEPVFRPSVFEDIEDTLETKIEAMSLYEAEARSFPHPRSPEALRAIARRWGSVVGLQAAEAFELVRWVRPRGR